MDLIGIGKAISGAVDTVADKFFVDAKDKKAFKLKALELQQQGEFKQQEIQLSAIIAEARSKDKWTSRARPAFLWTFYLILISLILIAPFLGIFFPDKMMFFYKNVSFGFKSLPEPLWWAFTTGYLGYTGARQYGKIKGSDR